MDEEMSLDKTLEWFCNKTYSPLPTDPASKKKMLPRMRAVGMITESELKKFEEEIDAEEARRKEIKKPKW